MAGADQIEGGTSRRDLIKGAVIAGTLAWTAPVIIDSLASPAAAATSGCYRAFYDWDVATSAFIRINTVPLPTGGACVPANCWNDAGKINYPGGIMVDGTTDPTKWRFTLDDPSCVIIGVVGGQGYSQGRTAGSGPICKDRVSPLVQDSFIEFPQPPLRVGPPNPGEILVYDEVKLVISCSGVVCTNCPPL